MKVNTAIGKKSVFAVLMLTALSILCSHSAYAQYWQKDTLETSKGNVEIEVVGHCFLHFVFNRMNIYIDPIPNVADLTRLPKADLILITATI